MNNERSLPPSIPQLRWDPWVRHRTPNCPSNMAAHCSGCVFSTHCCVCALGWWNVHKFRVWDTILGHTSHPFLSFPILETPGAVGSQCCGTWGAVGVRCLLSRGIEGGESAGHSLPPPTIPARPETRTHDLWVTTPTPYPLGHDCPMQTCRLHISVTYHHITIWSSVQPYFIST